MSLLTMDAAQALTTCIQTLPEGATLALPAGVYELRAPLHIERHALTLTTAGLQGTSATCRQGASCAELRASADFPSPEPMLSIGRAGQPVHHITLDHLTLDGNGATRRQDAQAMKNQRLSGGGRTVLEWSGGQNRLLGSAFVDTPGATAVGWAIGGISQGSVVDRNYFAHNGIDYGVDLALWADGLTVGLVDQATFTSNRFEDNTDVDFILGGATSTVVQGNQIVHTSRRSFAAFMLTNWSDPASPASAQWADFRGLEVTGNVIQCGDLCDIGMQLGVLTWIYFPDHWTSWRLMGGNIHHNEIHAQRQGINLAGCGTGDYATTLASNVLDVVAQPSAPMFKGARATGKLNVPALWEENFINFQQGQEQDIDMTTPWHALY